MTENSMDDLLADGFLAADTGSPPEPPRYIPTPPGETPPVPRRKRPKKSSYRPRPSDPSRSLLRPDWVESAWMQRKAERD